MKTFNYSERNLWRNGLIVFLYLTIWIIGLIWYFGGLIRLINNVNNYGTKLSVFLFFLVFFPPVFFLRNWFSSKISIKLEQGNLYFKKKNNLVKTIPIANINLMIINENDMNSLVLYDQYKHKIVLIAPNSNDDILVNEIAESIQQLASFKKQTIIKKILNTSYTSVTYLKM